MVIDKKIMEGSYGVHTYRDWLDKKWIEEGIFKDERLEGVGKRD